MRGSFVPACERGVRCDIVPVMTEETTHKPTVLPDYLGLSDDQLMERSGREFADAVVERSKLWAWDVIDPEKYTITELDPEEMHQVRMKWAERHAWMEWWFGVPVPAKQIVLLPNEDFGIKLLLSQQIIDEVKHQRLLSRRAAALGGSAKIERYVPEPEVVATAPEKMIDSDSPLEIAAALQCTGEVIVNENTTYRSVLFRLLDEETKQLFVDEIAPDEIRHIGVGVKIVTKYASTPELRRLVLKIQNRKFRTTYPRYLVDYRRFGAERTAPEPVVDGNTEAS